MPAHHGHRVHVHVHIGNKGTAHHKRVGRGKRGGRSRGRRGYGMGKSGLPALGVKNPRR